MKNTGDKEGKGAAMENAGAMIERGELVQEENGAWRVQSFQRPGLVTPFLRPLISDVYTVGDTVFFFLLADGAGGILGRE